MYGWTQHDGNVEIGNYLTLSSETMTSDEYDTWWSHFYAVGTTDVRDNNGFSADNFSATGGRSAEYMAAVDVVTTSQYSCGVYDMVESASGTGEDLFAYIFDDRDIFKRFVDHSEDLNYIL